MGSVNIPNVISSQSTNQIRPSEIPRTANYSVSTAPDPLPHFPSVFFFLRVQGGSGAETRYKGECTRNTYYVWYKGECTTHTVHGIRVSVLHILYAWYKGECTTHTVHGIRVSVLHILCMV